MNKNHALFGGSGDVETALRRRCGFGSERGHGWVPVGDGRVPVCEVVSMG